MGIKPKRYWNKSNEVFWVRDWTDAEIESDSKLDKTAMMSITQRLVKSLWKRRVSIFS